MLDQLSTKEQACLARIKKNYGILFRKAGKVYSIRPEIIAGICMRESHGGDLLDAELLGDGGHGHGLFQIDDRSFPEFCADPARYKNPITNALMACSILKDKRIQVRHICVKVSVNPTDAEYERMWIAAYNCGANSPVHAVRFGEDIDHYTTCKNYSWDVLRFAAFYAADPTLEGDEETKKYTV
jgi:hypothetical protein